MVDEHRPARTLAEEEARRRSGRGQFVVGISQLQEPQKKGAVTGVLNSVDELFSGPVPRLLGEATRAESCRRQYLACGRRPATQPEAEQPQLSRCAVCHVFVIAVRPSFHDAVDLIAFRVVRRDGNVRPSELVGVISRLDVPAGLHREFSGVQTKRRSCCHFSTSPSDYAAIASETNRAR